MKRKLCYDDTVMNFYKDIELEGKRFPQNFISTRCYVLVVEISILD